MNSDEQRSATRVPVALRIKLRYREVDTFVSKFATNISSRGIFISSRKPRDIGTELRFELRLADNSELIVGKGRVAWIREYDPDFPKRPYGMGVEFLSLDPQSQSMVDRIVLEKTEQGLANPQGIPFAPELSSDVLTPGLRAASQAEPEVLEQPGLEREQEKVPQHLSKGDNGDLDVLSARPVNVERALLRARALCRTDSAKKETLEEALSALMKLAPPSVAVDVDDASEQLARRIGGSPVRRFQHPQDVSTPGTEEGAEAEDDVEHGPEKLRLQQDELGDEASEDELVQDELISDDLMDDEEETAVADDAIVLHGRPLIVPDAQTQNLDEYAPDAEIDDEDGLVVDLDEDDDIDAEIYTDPDSITAIPSGIDVDVLDADALEVSDIHDLLGPGGSPMELSSLAELPDSQAQTGQAPANDDDDESETPAAES